MQLRFVKHGVYIKGKYLKLCILFVICIEEMTINEL